MKSTVWKITQITQVC